VYIELHAVGKGFMRKERREIEDLKDVLMDKETLNLIGKS
jgi:hypothetical protein